MLGNPIWQVVHTPRREIRFRFSLNKNTVPHANVKNMATYSWDCKQLHISNVCVELWHRFFDRLKEYFWEIGLHLFAFLPRFEKIAASCLPYRHERGINLLMQLSTRKPLSIFPKMSSYSFKVTCCWKQILNMFKEIWEMSPELNPDLNWLQLKQCCIELFPVKKVPFWLSMSGTEHL